MIDQWMPPKVTATMSVESCFVLASTPTQTRNPRSAPICGLMPPDWATGRSRPRLGSGIGLLGHRTGGGAAGSAASSEVVE
jgi:hypothetical protein